MKRYTVCYVENPEFVMVITKDKESAYALRDERNKLFKATGQSKQLQVIEEDIAS